MGHSMYLVCIRLIPNHVVSLRSLVCNHRVFISVVVVVVVVVVVIVLTLTL